MSTTENPQGRTPEDLEALIRRLQKENDRLKSEKNRVGISFRRVPESGAQIKALYDERFPYFEHVPEHSYTLSDRHADEELAGTELSQPTDGNTTLIEAENLAALSALQLTHQGKVDVIYIDPPYNTGNKDFVYNDARTSTIEDAVDDEGNTLSAEDYEKTLDGNVRSVGKDNPERHSLWLSFMEKRLWLAKQLLSDEGVIFVSIDDNEQARLKLLMDEVFGEENFVGCLPRRVTSSGKSGANMSIVHDYVFSYSKTEKAKIKPRPHNDPGFKFKDTHADERGLYKLNQTLDYDSLSYSQSLDYVIEHDGMSIVPGGDPELFTSRKNGNHRKTDWAWRWNKDLLQFGINNDFVVFKTNKEGRVRVYTKTYQNASIVKNKYTGKHEIEYAPRTLTPNTLDYINRDFTNDRATKEVMSILDRGSFTYPKSTTLLKDIVNLHPNPNALILDFFAGSGTTAHAVAELNKEDGGNRQCILVTHGDENGKNIAEDVTAQRMKRVLSGKNWADGKDHESLPGELNYYRLQFAEKVLSNYHAADVMRDKFLGYVSLEQDVVLSKDQLDEEGFHMLSSSHKNVAVVSDDFLLMDGSLDELMSEAYVEGKENLIYLPLADDTDINEYVPEGWTPIGFPVSYMDSYKSLISLMKSNKTLLQPVSESE